MTKITWEFCQNNSDSILASGTQLLQKKKKSSFENTFVKTYGNYLISDSTENWQYIGEAKDISKRLKQQGTEKNSTFYKNYRKFEKQFNELPKGLKISQFQIRTIETMLGRKEMEEFGIVNIPTNLNKFQKGKRHVFSNSVKSTLWLEVQSNFEKILKQGESELLKSKGYTWFEAIIKDLAGLYWVEHPKHDLIYIGESSSIKSRYKTHSGTTYFSALRRHIGENVLGFQLQVRDGKKRYFKSNEDQKVTSFLEQCTIKPMEISFGRYELEEYLIRKHKPLLNRKENK